jgi:hypothetical protein
MEDLVDLAAEDAKQADQEQEQQIKVMLVEMIMCQETHQNLVLEAVVPEKSDLMRYLLHTHMVLVVLVEMVCHLRLLVVM